jgi:hypothetical protein
MSGRENCRYSRRLAEGRRTALIFPVPSPPQKN